MTAEAILGHFREQAIICDLYGSKFTSQLISRLADDFSGGGIVADLVQGWKTNPRADALSLRFAGALHAAVLMGSDAALSAAYPSDNSTWTMDEVWPLARNFMQRNHAFMADFLSHPPQTNETRRSIALLAAFLTFAKSWSGPIDMFEIGASAGLNLNWDRFAYRTGTWTWGAPTSEVLIDTQWRGAPPPTTAQPIIRARAACDLSPLDIRNPQERLRLKSYIWPDQPDRLARFDGAVALALANDVHVERASADVWLRQKLANRGPGAATLIYHSVFLQYPPRETREAIISAIREAGASARDDAPVAWARLEPEGVTDDVANGLRFVVDFHTWPGGERRILGYTDGHVREVFSEIEA